MKKLFLLAFLLIACQEDIAVIPTNPSDSSGNEEENTGIPTQYQACLNALSDNTLDVVTWNIENFPQASTSSVDGATDILKNMKADIIAVQEITSTTAFNTLVGKLGGWSGQLVNVSGSQDLGFIYKTSEITPIGSAKALTLGGSSPFPRAPVQLQVRHKNGLSVTLINIHLKCCGGTDNEARRREASRLLKTYIDQNLPNEAVIVLGDWNDEIYEGGSNDVFGNFINDTSNYRFADADIAKGSASGWSYPSYPSHIDHQLITNELFDNLTEVRTVPINQCFTNYYALISDHRPVLARFKAD